MGRRAQPGLEPTSAVPQLQSSARASPVRLVGGWWEARGQLVGSAGDPGWQM